MNQPCEHLDQVREVAPSSNGCEDCLRIGGRWVHLRMRMTCGHVGCCDSSPHRHATAHHREHDHPLVQSYEPGEDWWYCYPDDLSLRSKARRRSPTRRTRAAGCDEPSQAVLAETDAVGAGDDQRDADQLGR